MSPMIVTTKIKKLFFVILIMTTTLSCTDSKKTIKINSKELKSNEPRETIKIDSFLNYIKLDSTIEKGLQFDYLLVKRDSEYDSIVSLCHCKKNKKNNSISIQIQTAIPTKKELDTLDKSERSRRNRFLQIGTSRQNFNRQLKFLTINLKDSIVKSIELYSKSTEKEYKGGDFDSLSINKYNIKISKFDYSIASDVFGNFELRLARDFGLNKNDTIIKGRFLCNNWRILEKEDIKKLKFK
jgi:hypothetical protein